jgi:hypothetical protein
MPTSAGWSRRTSRATTTRGDNLHRSDLDSLNENLDAIQDEILVIIFSASETRRPSVRRSCLRPHRRQRRGG